MRFSVGNNTAGQPSWWLYANNNEMVAWAGETFSSTYNARRAAASFKVGAKTAYYEVYQDSGSRYRWRGVAFVGQGRLLWRVLLQPLRGRARGRERAGQRRIGRSRLNKSGWALCSPRGPSRTPHDQ